MMIASVTSGAKDVEGVEASVKFGVGSAKLALASPAFRGCDSEFRDVGEPL